MNRYKAHTQSKTSDGVDDYYEDHLRKKIQELKYAIDTKDSDMYELIGSIRDVFSSPYISTPIVSPNLVKEL